MKKIIKIIESNKLFILGIALGVGISCISVYSAANIITSKRVGYTNTQSHLTADNVQDAIDELYTHARNYQSLKADMLDTVYPVGSIYISTSLSTTSQVAAKLGGTWQVFGDGRVLRGTTGTAGSTGGSDTVTLKAENLPSHSHSMSHTHGTPATNISSSGAHTHSTTASTTTVNGTTNNTLTAASNGAHTHTVSTNTTFTVSFGVGSGVSGIPGGQSGWGSYSKAHWYTITINSGGAHTHNVTGTIKIPALSIASSGAHTHQVPAMTTNSQSTTTTGATGSGTAFSVQDPYITVYMYKRTA